MKTVQEIPISTPPFLQGGGEMGALTRKFDWSKTSVGIPENWPQSLRITVSMILSSKFPMFLWWGEELIQFYNDAYRPSLGNEGKHPTALGQNAADCWPEIWDIIHPLINQVRTTGEATWSEDQLVPIYRNGTIEDVYWTFGYSPIRDESEQVQGVLVVCTETTEKVGYLKQLAESKNELEFAIEATELGTWDLNPVTNKFTANSRLKEWFGLRPDEEVDLSLAINAIAAEDRQQVTDAIANALEYSSGGHYDIEYTIIHPLTYHKRVVKAKGRALFNDKKTAYRFNGTLQDITDQKKAIQVELTARKKVEESEQQVRSIIESAPFPIGVYAGREMKIEFANKAMLEAWGKGNDIVGKLYTEVLPELDNQAIFEQLDHVFTTGIPFHARSQRLDLQVNGVIQTFYFNYSFTPLYNALGAIYGVMNTAADVTDLHWAKQKVEENEKNIRNTILKAPVAMCILRGAKHVVEIANERMIELWGRTATDVMNKPIFEGLPEASDQGFEQMLDSVFKTGETISAQDIPITLPRNGKIEIVYVNFVYEAYKEAHGNITGIIAVATDVTDQVIARKKIEEAVAERTKELAAANNNLERSNAQLAQFAYIASHDLQEPLRKVGVFSQMMEQSLGNIDERSKNYLNKINVSVSRMRTLIRDVLTYSQLSKENELFETISLQNVIDDVKNDFELLIQQKNAAIQCENLPAIEAVPLQMSQLFSNLISNALKFSREDVQPVININTMLLSDADVASHSLPYKNMRYYNIEFSDNGIGFKQEYAEQIFNIFQRLHGKTEYAGTGIGLAMCKKIAQNHGGDIHAKASIGTGAVFNVILPEKQMLKG